MTKIISADNLGEDFNEMLDELKEGETHFLIMRDAETAGVLLSVEKFNEIMQMLEALNSLEYLPADDFDFYGADISGITPIGINGDDKTPANEKGKRSGEELREQAAKLGIHIIK